MPCSLKPKEESMNPILAWIKKRFKQRFPLQKDIVIGEMMHIMNLSPRKTAFQNQFALERAEERNDPNFVVEFQEEDNLYILYHWRNDICYEVGWRRDLNTFTGFAHGDDVSSYKFIDAVASLEDYLKIAAKGLSFAEDESSADKGLSIAT